MAGKHLGPARGGAASVGQVNCGLAGRAAPVGSRKHPAMDTGGGIGGCKTWTCSRPGGPQWETVGTDWLKDDNVHGALILSCVSPSWDFFCLTETVTVELSGGVEHAIGTRSSTSLLLSPHPTL